jgi:hypothetical protein
MTLKTRNAESSGIMAQLPQMAYLYVPTGIRAMEKIARARMDQSAAPWAGGSGHDWGVLGQARRRGV